MGYLQLAAVAGLGSSGLGITTNPLALILLALALCAFGAALNLLLRHTYDGRTKPADPVEVEAEAAEPQPVEVEAD